MKPKFREDKAAQAAAVLLKLRGNGMSHLKLMKLLYLADREALLQLGRPIVYDSYVSMKLGPVLSETLNLMHGESNTNGPWVKAISPPSDNEVRLIEDPGMDKLSDAEEQILRNVFAKYGAMSRWELCDYTHNLEEWQDPEGSSIRIEYREVLRAGNKSDAETEAIMADLEHLAAMEIFLERQD